MVDCRIVDEFADHHVAVLGEHQSDDTWEVALAKKAAVDMAWDAVYEHRATCPICKGWVVSSPTVHGFEGQQTGGNLFALSSPIICPMAPCRCVVSFTDADGIVHEVEVYAASVYDAVGTAVQEWSHGGIAEGRPCPMTELTVLVHRPPVTHRLKLQQVTKWAKGGGKSPHDVLRRQYVRKLLELKDEN